MILLLFCKGEKLTSYNVLKCKDKVSAAVAELLKLKASYKEMTGEDLAAAGKGKKEKNKEQKKDENQKQEQKVVSAAVSSKEAEAIKDAITKQGDKVRMMKTNGAPKVRILQRKGAEV